MKRIFAAAAIAVAFLPSPAPAQERVGSAALGAVSGGLILGPVGAVAGAVVGYTAGPSIARAWGLHDSPPPRPAKRARPAAPRNASVTPRAGTQGAAAQGAREGAQPRARRPAPRVAMPPVQALE
jgi:hypothetical protein